MKNFLTITVLALTLSFGFTQISFAVCVEGPPDTFTCNTAAPNPDTNGVQQEANNANLTINVLPGAGIDATSNNDSCIDTGNGDNTVDVDNGNLDCDVGGGGNNGVNTEDGADIVTVKDSTISARDIVSSGGGPDTVNIERSMLISGDNCTDTDSGSDTVNFTDVICMREVDGFELSSGDDVVSILRSQILCAEEGSCQEAVTASTGNDDITVVESILRNRFDDIIDLGPDNDTLRLGTGADLGSSIDCSNGFDTIVFFMDVPEDLLPLVSSQIAAANPSADSITINGLSYEWRDCELLVNELVGVPNPVRPIPTLSEWGLIAMAALIGIVSLFAVRKKKMVV